jgi:hypothetical protein
MWSLVPLPSNITVHDEDWLGVLWSGRVDWDPFGCLQGWLTTGGGHSLLPGSATSRSHSQREWLSGMEGNMKVTCTRPNGPVRSLPGLWGFRNIYCILCMVCVGLGPSICICYCPHHGPSWLKEQGGVLVGPPSPPPQGLVVSPWRDASPVAPLRGALAPSPAMAPEPWHSSVQAIGAWAEHWAALSRPHGR